MGQISAMNALYAQSSNLMELVRANLEITSMRSIKLASCVTVHARPALGLNSANHVQKANN